MTKKQLVIYGAGGFAREVAWLVEQINGTVSYEAYDLVAFIDDNPAAHGKNVNGIPVVGLQEARGSWSEARLVGGIGNPKTRQCLLEKASAIGFSFETLIHPRVEMSNRVEISDGTVICAGNILTTNIKLGENVQINLDCTIGHDVIMGKYTTLAPGVHVSGRVHFGERVYVGTGAVIINGLDDRPIVVDDDAIVGAAACVTKSVPKGQTVVGVPAKSIVRK